MHRILTTAARASAQAMTSAARQVEHLTHMLSNDKPIAGNCNAMRIRIAEAFLFARADRRTGGV